MLITSKVLSVTGLSSKHPTQYAAALGMTKRHRKLSTREVEHLSPTPFPALFSSYEGVSLCTCFSPSCGSFLTPVAFTSSLIASLSLGCPGGFPCSSLLRCCWWSWGTGKLLCQDPAVKKTSLPSLKLCCVDAVSLWTSCHSCAYFSVPCGTCCSFHLECCFPTWQQEPLLLLIFFRCHPFPDHLTVFSHFLCSFSVLFFPFVCITP